MLEKILQTRYEKTIKECSNEEIYFGLLEATKEMAANRCKTEGKKKIYYISAEFLIGKLLSNNLINLGIYDEVRDVLKQNGKNISDIENVELEPSLGNGGLGRLAACFLDSIATLGLNGAGIGLNYHFGLFCQIFSKNLQNEQPNPWITDESWLVKSYKSYTVQFKDLTVKSKLYDVAVTGYDNRTNWLHLFDIDTIDESIVKEGISFEKEDIAKNLTLFLYPDDSDEKGELLRIYQQYFMVSNAAQMILEECEQRGSNLYDLYDYAVIQINDTHPTMVIPELIRLLVDKGIDMDTAIVIVSKTCAYTNHTILSEALEKWPIKYLNNVVPQLMPIIEVLDQKVKSKFPDPSVGIIDPEGRVHMAHIDIHYGFSVNGVAALHTDILKQNELNHFYKIYPEKFNNKTNGITFRRWLMHCNYPLTKFLTKQIGEGFKKDAGELEKLLAFKEDPSVQDMLLQIKHENKLALTDYLLKTQGIEIDENSIFDIQIKRLHEYKRQQMNALYIIHKYLEIKKGKMPATPITLIFGAKAAPAYTIAKDIIHLILCLQELVNGDKDVNQHLKVVMVENYNVTLAEKLIPACDISEQISLASKEASGTGNMKFMLNGAITLGTMDGANVEIADLVGDENIYIFGESSEEVIAHYANRDYISKDYYEKDDEIREMVDFIVNDTMLSLGKEENLRRLYQEILNKDWFMTLLDLKAYIKKKEEIIADYEDREKWAKMMIENISRAGYFSSDRTILEYNQDIWKVN
ncbi:MAG: glycogen/starch/alpha-glucan phosphorylase [Anaerocolumna sp.]